METSLITKKIVHLKPVERNTVVVLLTELSAGSITVSKTMNIKVGESGPFKFSETSGSAEGKTNGCTANSYFT